MFRFPFENQMFEKYKDNFFDNINMMNSTYQASNLVCKCINCGFSLKDDKFESVISPNYVSYATHGIGNCYIWRPLGDDGFYPLINGYMNAADYIFNDRFTI